MMRYELTVLAVLSVLMLGGCGVKPEALRAPEGSEERVFPRKYPDPATDPQGTL